MVYKSSSGINKKHVVNLKNICKSYGNKNILSDINFFLYENEIHALIGPNGAGKTTLMRLILKLIEPTSGQINFGYENVAAALENDYLFENKTGLQNIKSFSCYFNLNMQNLDMYANLLNLKKDMDVKVQYYSKGMKRKLSIMIAIMRDTDFILLDEPTSGVDPQSRIEIRKLFGYLKGANKTILITSHDLSEIEKVCDTITILNEGHMIKKLTNKAGLDLEQEFFNALEK